jgi:selenophosphate synthetase-related protein
MAKQQIIDVDALKTDLGRSPNEEEVRFLSQFVSRLKPVLRWRQALELLHSKVKDQDKSLLLVSEQKTDPFKTDGKLVCLSQGFIRQFQIQTDEGIISGGIRLHPSKRALIPAESKILFFPANRYLTSFVKKVYSSPQIYDIRPVFRNGLPLAIYSFLHEASHGFGICLHGFPSPKDFFHHKTAGLLFVVEDGAEKNILQAGAMDGCTGMDLGHLTEDGIFIFKSGDLKSIRIPVKVLNNLLGDTISSSNQPPVLAPEEKFQITQRSLNYGSAIRDLLRQVRSKAEPQVMPQKLSVTSQIIWGAFEGHQKFAVALNNNDHLKIRDWGIRGMAFLSNASRRLVCRGVKPETATILIQSDSPSREFTEYIQGLSKAAAHLRLSMEHSGIGEKESGEMTSRVAAGGFLLRDVLFPQAFQQVGDFISILGSHRGELGGSLFYQQFFDSMAGIHPILDLNMEVRIQEAILTGIQAGLIQSARPVSGGGLAVAVARSLHATNSTFGARIHFSRKLSTEELLFGESQGLILISIREDDLMEFERICMNIGVPSTTIGRVTGDGLFTFNDVVKLTVNELHSK